MFDFPLEPYVKLLATVHQLSSRIESPLPVEQFDLPFKGDLLAGLERLWSESFEHPQERGWRIGRRNDAKHWNGISRYWKPQLENCDHETSLMW